MSKDAKVLEDVKEDEPRGEPAGARLPLPEGIRPRAPLWGQLIDFNRWLISHLHLDKAFERIEAAAVSTSKKPESPAEALKNRSEAIEAAASTLISEATLIRALADADAAVELGNVLFEREDGEEVSESDCRAIPREELFAVFFSLRGDSVMLGRVLTASEPGWN